MGKNNNRALNYDLIQFKNIDDEFELEINMIQ